TAQPSQPGRPLWRRSAIVPFATRAPTTPTLMNGKPKTMRNAGPQPDAVASPRDVRPTSVFLSVSGGNCGASAQVPGLGFGVGLGVGFGVTFTLGAAEGEAEGAGDGATSTLTFAPSQIMSEVIASSPILMPRATWRPCTSIVGSIPSGIAIGLI